MLQPTIWPFRGIRRVLIGILIVSAWCPPPSAFPVLAVALFWLCWAVPAYVRRLGRLHLARKYFLWDDVRYVDRAGIVRLRRMFFTALSLAVLHVPFFAAFTCSYPFLAHSARYWLTIAPAIEQPRPGPMIYGLMLVTDRDAPVRAMVFYPPGGRMEFSIADDEGRLAVHFVPIPPELAWW